ncbi:hypothetical protein ACMGGS_18585 [Superficieibacter sp. BNK-5]|uniref:hypothetical protein n=1 Tax=Superficieibacter sp. BNK-5 TaxID=3376142 RepID=UPI0039BF43F8
MNIFLVVLGLAGLIVTCIFGFREPTTLLFIIPVFILIGFTFMKIADKAKFNPRLSKGEQKGTVRFCAAAFLLISLIINTSFLIWINSQSPIFGEEYSARIRNEDAIKKAEIYDRSLRMEAFNKIASAETSVKKKLKDSSSAKFSGAKIGKQGAVCGYVNAKNSFGAYAGDSRYISIFDKSQIDDGSDDFAKSWDSICI